MPEEGQTLSADKAIRVQFDQYLELDSVINSGATLVSGEATAAIRLSYDPVDRALLATPTRNLRVGLGYRFAIPADDMQGLNGSQLRTPFELNFRATELEEAVRGTIDFESDVMPIFQKTCGCHGPEPRIFPDLSDVNAMLDRPSVRQPEFELLKPGRPLESYLVLRLLGAYPGIWGESKDISDSDARIIIQWVGEMGSS